MPELARRLAVAVALLLAGCGHSSRARTSPVENEIARPLIDAGPDGDVAEYSGGDGCSYECWVRECEDRQAEQEIDAGTSCDEQCIAWKVADGMDPGAAESDCIEDCVCGE